MDLANAFSHFLCGRKGKATLYLRGMACSILSLNSSRETQKPLQYANSGEGWICNQSKLPPAEVLVTHYIGDILIASP